MRRVFVSVSLIILVLVAVVLAARSRVVNPTVYDWLSDTFFTRAGLINWVLLTASAFCLVSSVIFVFVLRNQRRRKGRSGVSLILAKRSYGGSLAAKNCGDMILNAVSARSFSSVAEATIARLVIDHLVDYRFNVKLYNYMNFRMERDNLIIAPEDLELLIAAIESWKDQSVTVSQTLDSFVRNYAGIEKAREFKRAIYFLDRRKKYFVGICDEFVIDVKNATISVLSRHLA
jgi:hypothetical protein